MHGCLNGMVPGLPRRWPNWGWGDGVLPWHPHGGGTTPSRPTAHWPHSTLGPSSPGPRLCLQQISPSWAAPLVGLRRAGARCRARSSRALDRGRLPRGGDGWAGAPGQGTRSVAGRGEGRWVRGGAGWRCRSPSLSCPQPQTGRGGSGFTLQFTVTRTSFHLLSVRESLSRVLTRGPTHPRVLGTGPTAASVGTRAAGPARAQGAAPQEKLSAHVCHQGTLPAHVTSAGRTVRWSACRPLRGQAQLNPLLPAGGPL